MLAVVVRHTKTGAQALNVLTATLRADPRTRDVDLRFVGAGDELASTVAALADSRRLLVLWSFYSPEVVAVGEELAALRSATPAGTDVVHIAGGVHATAEPTRTLGLGFDLVATGEGEATIVPLVLAFVDASAASPHERVRGLSGLGYLDELGSYRGGPGAQVELDDYPPFNVPDRKLNPIEITRGCVYACTFCQTPFMFKARFRHRSVANVREHVAAQTRLGARYLRFVTPTSLSYGSSDTSVNLDAVEALLGGVREEMGPDGRLFFGTFPSEIRPEHVSERALAILRKYVDNDNLVIGGQSGSARVLDASRRGHGVEEVVIAAELAAKHGFRPNVDLLFGLPGEEPEDQRATVELMRRLVACGARVHSHAFLPLPGTPLANGQPVPIGKELTRELGMLEASGRSYGHWRTQLVSGDQLARRRSGNAKR